MANATNHERSLTLLISELKGEFSEFVQTRIQMLRAEIQEKAQMLKMSAPTVAIAVLLLLFGFVCLTGALVAVIAMAFGGGISSWAVSLLIVGVAYAVLGGLAGFFAYRQFTSEGLAPKRTMNVLKQDQAWLANEARSQI